MKGFGEFGVSSTFGFGTPEAPNIMPSYTKEPTPHIAWVGEVKGREAEKNAKTGGMEEASRSLPDVQRNLAPFAQAVHNMSSVEKVVNELAFGRRVGLYELRGEIGSGNFSKVAVGVHDLTKGKTLLHQWRLVYYVNHILYFA